MSAEELQKGLQEVDIRLVDDEVRHLREFFNAKYGKIEITVEQFEKILHTKWERTCNEKDARKALYDLKTKFSSQKAKTQGTASVDKLLRLNNPDKGERMTVRQFKIALSTIKIFG